jgi:hypothetical protein
MSNPTQRCQASGEPVPVWPAWEAVGADHKVECWECGRRIGVSARGLIEHHNRPESSGPARDGIQFARAVAGGTPVSELGVHLQYDGRTKEGRAFKRAYDEELTRLITPRPNPEPIVRDWLRRNRPDLLGYWDKIKVQEAMILLVSIGFDAGREWQRKQKP